MHMTDQLFQTLHDRATCGERLTSEEQAALNQWYERQDREESQLIGRLESPASLANLRSQVDAAVAQLQIVSQHIQETVSMNDSIRQEISGLQRQLVQHTADQAA
jgi:hypothetical protein